MIRTVIVFLKKLLLGGKVIEHKFIQPAIQNQNNTLKKVWDDETEKTFGIERIFRLFLVLSAYLFPTLYVRHFSGKYGLLSRKIAIELIVLMKLFLPILYFKFELVRCRGRAKLTTYKYRE